MICEFGIFVAICISQATPLDLGRYSLEKSTSSSEEGDPALTLDQLVSAQTDTIKESLGSAAIDRGFGKGDIETMVRCIRSCKDKLENLGAETADSLMEILERLESSDSQAIRKYLKPLTAIFKKAADTFRQTPKELYKHLEKGRLRKVWRTLVNCWTTINQQSRNLKGILRYIREEDAEEASKIAMYIFHTGNRLMVHLEDLSNFFTRCVEKN